MEKVEFQQNVRSAQIVIEAPQDSEYDYQIPMLTFNEPEGLLPVSECYEGEARRLYYDVTGAGSLAAMMVRGTFDCPLIEKLVHDLVRTLECAGRYLLDSRRVKLDPAMIYYKDGSFRFCYIPFGEPDFGSDLENLAAFITENADGSDVSAAKMAARLYKAALEENVDIESLERAICGDADEVQDQDEDELDFEEYRMPWEDEEEPIADEKDFKEEFPLWSEVIEEPERRSLIKQRKRGRRKKGTASSWGDWSAFIAENGS